MCSDACAVQTIAGQTSRSGKPRLHKAASRTLPGCLTHMAGRPSCSTTPGSSSWEPRGQAQRRPDAPLQHIRCSLQSAASCCRRAWLVRDVFEEMLLDGVRPDAATFEEAMWANMRSRRGGRHHLLLRPDEAARHGARGVRCPADSRPLHSLLAAWPGMMSSDQPCPMLAGDTTHSFAQVQKRGMTWGVRCAACKARARGPSLATLHLLGDTTCLAWHVPAM